MADLLCTSTKRLHKITPSIDYNWCLQRMHTQLIEPNNQNSQKSVTFFSQPIRNCYYKALGTCVINSPMFPPSLGLHRWVSLKWYHHRAFYDYGYLTFTYTKGTNCILTKQNDNVIKKHNLKNSQESDVFNTKICYRQ